MPSAAWCRDHESCHTLADYLPRRTNTAQWLPLGGLGAHDEHLPVICAVCLGDITRIIELEGPARRFAAATNFGSRQNDDRE